MVEKIIKARYRLAIPSAAENSFRLDVDMEMPGQGITAIFGRSGSGKTTLLRCIAGLQQITDGQTIVNGEVWQDQNISLPVHKRPLGYVFQEASLFPHLTAQGNIDYAIKRSNKVKCVDYYNHIIGLMGIEHTSGRYPDQLSGGERQRVAIARALLINPSILLMDEPLASLDDARKQEILPYLKRLRHEIDIPILYVSHSVDEIARLADHLVILENGCVVAQGQLSDVLSNTNLPVKLGEETGVVLEAEITRRDTKWGLMQISIPGADMWVKDTGEETGNTIRVRILARDVSLTLENHNDTSILNRLSAKILDITPDADNPMCLIKLMVGESTILARITKRSVENLKLHSDLDIWAQIKSVAVVQ